MDRILVFACVILMFGTGGLGKSRRTNSSPFSTILSEMISILLHSVAPNLDPEMKRYVKVEVLVLKSAKFAVSVVLNVSSIVMSKSNCTSETSFKHIVAS